MIISRKRNKPLHPHLLMDNTVSNEVEINKHLGLMFSPDCSWYAHIEEIVKKAWRRINILRAFKFKRVMDSLEHMYISFIRPLLEYAGPMWDKQTLQMFYKRVHGLAPSYLNYLVPTLVQENSQYSLRNARNIQTLQCNTNLFYNSFLPHLFYVSGMIL